MTAEELSCYCAVILFGSLFIFIVCLMIVLFLCLLDKDISDVFPLVAIISGALLVVSLIVGTIASGVDKQNKKNIPIRVDESKILVYERTSTCDFRSSF